jgi:DNA-binding transcriptional regulator YiaG
MTPKKTKEDIRAARERGGFLQSGEIIEIRGGCTRSEFSRVTGLALSTIIRWENDLLLQSRANDRYLRLLREAWKREQDGKADPRRTDSGSDGPETEEAVTAVLRGDMSATRRRAPVPTVADEAAELREKVGALTMQRDLLANALRSALATMEPGPLVDALRSMLSIISSAGSTRAAAVEPAAAVTEPDDRTRS